MKIKNRRPQQVQRIELSGGRFVFFIIRIKAIEANPI
jgi:hypothetical protein